MISFRFGNTQWKLTLPESVLTEMMPAYLHACEGDFLPRIEASVSFHDFNSAPAEAASLPVNAAFNNARVIREGEAWSFFVNLPQGPCKPDVLPTRCVLPAILHVMAHHRILPIHASGVVRRGKILLFAGPSGSGKSTTAARLAAASAPSVARVSVAHAALPPSGPVFRGSVQRSRSDKSCDDMTAFEFFADDRILVWKEQGIWLATPSFERPNPFTRWVGLTPEVGARPAPRRPAAWGKVYPVDTIYHLSLEKNEPSRIIDLSAIDALRELSMVSSAATASATTEAHDEFAGAGIPAKRLTLGCDFPTLVARILDQASAVDYELDE